MRQLPVYSPVTWGGVLAGAVAAVRGDRGGVLERRVSELLALRYSARAVLLTDSGTSALRLAIAGAVSESGGPVALPGYACYDLAAAAEGAGANVTLYDIDPATLGPDPGSLSEAALTRPSAVVIAHLFGYPVDVDAIRETVGDALLIEDAAQGAGGRLGGRRLGSLGSLSVLSFGRGKGMTGGGGGALLAHDDRGGAILDLARRRLDGRDPRRGGQQVLALVAQRILGRPSLYGIAVALPVLHLGETVYHPPRTPNPSVTATLAVLERAVVASDHEVGVRKGNAQRLAVAVARSAHLAPISVVAGAEPGYLRMPVLLEGGARREVSRAARLGITQMYPMTLAALPSLGPRLVGPRLALLGATTLAERLVTLPTHGLLDERALAAIEEWAWKRAGTAA